MNDQPPRPRLRTPPPAPTLADAPVRCPRCQANLIDPNGASWCPSCGYCALLETHAILSQTERPTQEAISPSSSARIPRLGASEFLQFADEAPTWLRALMVGMVLIIGISVIAHHYLPERGYPRLWWSTSELGGGILLVLAAHVWASRQVPAERVRARSRGSYSIVEMWRVAFSQLPQTRAPMNLLAWGFSMILSATLVVGGFGWWLHQVKFVDQPPPAARSGNPR